ncbi:MAG: nuclear transport factor 2 family protein [Gammaproteobacteria bacterium]|nr:nuclear transport factor 2 family protein [Gammaproteobacteria bacterium]MDH4256136.1 nuclear transport factor 2 family protein [Gammaproteobacteria bacterium]MDH5310621.1 nuclear transport factor 2 family protein [Gammaproteobacteria bacterium]
MTPAEKSVIEWQCRQLALQFIAHSDRQEWAAMCALLTDDAVFARPTDPDRPIRGRAAIQSAFEARPAGRITRHVCANHIVTALSPSRASGSLYALLYTGDPSNRGPLGIIAEERQLVGEFDDDYVLTDEGWRIESRRGRIIFSTS